GGHRLLPRTPRHFGMQRRAAVRIAALHVYLVRELVDDEIHTGVRPVRARLDVRPRQDNRTAWNRLAGKRLVAPAHDPRLVPVFEPGDEFVGIDDDVLPTVV